MIIVDTNVVSELMKPTPSEAVQLGLPIDGFDAQIASICRAHGAALATRNLKDFRHTDVDLIDPWQNP
jgi:predicted nucleic acid-binding protein